MKQTNYYISSFANQYKHYCTVDTHFCCCVNGHFC